MECRARNLVYMIFVVIPKGMATIPGVQVAMAEWCIRCRESGPSFLLVVQWRVEAAARV